MAEEFLWSEAERPHKVEDCILPPDKKAMFQAFVEKKNLPHMLLYGTSGVGKTSVAKAMLDEMQSDYIVINASMSGIDTLRTDIQNFASTVAWAEGRKYVILDEADYLTPATQPALRNFMEQFSSNCGFILTCNNKNRIIPALHSRCTCIDFTLTKAEKQQMGALFFKRAEGILKKYDVKFDRATVATVIQKFAPDFRRTLNELQRYSACGEINSGILTNLQAISLAELITFMKDKNFSSVRKWVAENLDAEPASIFRSFYDVSVDHFDVKFIPELVMIIAEYSHKATMCLDQEINLAAFMVQVMLTAEWKK
jgi:DNA polymerase III delta prime subunit